MRWLAVFELDSLAVCFSPISVSTAANYGSKECVGIPFYDLNIFDARVENIPAY